MFLKLFFPRLPFNSNRKSRIESRRKKWPTKGRIEAVTDGDKTDNSSPRLRDRQMGWIDWWADLVTDVHRIGNYGRIGGRKKEENLKRNWHFYVIVCLSLGQSAMWVISLLWTASLSVCLSTLFVRLWAYIHFSTLPHETSPMPQDLNEVYWKKFKDLFSSLP